ncbi:hypothetical protein V1956_12855 [Yersinia sp. 2540 StPb PI]|uniref:hypothetical protein n=1 Tax=Yersinia sp. 2540 StPb PI TaxID=3117406 RepID=UPI003FA49368
MNKQQIVVYTRGCSESNGGAAAVFDAVIEYNSIIISAGMRKILNKVFASAIDNHYHHFALRDKASSFWF